MNNTNETIGLKVLSVSPAQKESDVNVNSTIDIAFSSDINPATLMKNVVVLEDINRIYKNVNSLKDYSKYAAVKGNVSYVDKVLTFTPLNPFKVNTCYIVMLNDGISDIIGNRLVQKHISCFYTELEATRPPVKITSPKYGCISSEIPSFVWQNQAAASYRFQVSKKNTFEVLLYDEIIPGNEVEETITHTPNFNVSEGMYFIRVKSEPGDWSDVHQIFIKPITDAVVAEQDTPELQNLDEFLDGLNDPIEILEYFPTPGSVNNTLKSNIIYIKIKGKVDESRISFEDCSVYGESTDEEHEEYGHEDVEGVWTLVYDSYFDVTYIIFTPVSLEPEEPDEELPEEDEEPPAEEPGDDGDDTEEPGDNPEDPGEIPENPDEPDDDSKEDSESSEESEGE